MKKWKSGDLVRLKVSPSPVLVVDRYVPYYHVGEMPVSLSAAKAKRKPDGEAVRCAQLMGSPEGGQYINFVELHEDALEAVPS